MPDPLYAVKMRASRDRAHVSGAERIVPAADAPETAARLVRRALVHPKGVPDDIRLSVLAAGEPLRIPALAVHPAPPAATPAEGLAAARRELAAAGIPRAADVVAMLLAAPPMRGAMLVDADSLERLDPDPARGVRATLMDAARPAGVPPPAGSSKDHFAEAVVLASKVQAAPGIVAEICISDDPDYATGYVASRARGYRRLFPLKAPGDPHGGRVFLFRGPRSLVPETLRFLEAVPVLVENVPAAPTPAAPVPTPHGAASADAPRWTLLDAELDAIRKAGLHRECHVCDGPTGPRATVDGRPLLVLSSNDYCDLARDPRVVRAAADAARRFGTGSGGSRLVTGTQPPHAALERHLARFKGSEDALVFASGYMANLGTVAALAGPGDVILSDALNHASLIDGCRLSRAQVVVYRHADMDDLARKLAACRAFRRRLVVSDAVFSMDGDVLDLPRFVALCRDADAFSLIDEAHSTGVLGATGRGLCEHFGDAARPDILVGTLSKALGSAGGFVCGRAALVDFLRNRARPFVFSTSPPASAMAAADAALEALEAEPWRAAAVRDNAAFLVAELARHGLRTASDSAIVPIPVGDERAAMQASRRLLDEGFWIPAIRYPTVARGSARLRAAVMSAHSRIDLARAADAIARAVRQTPPAGA